MYKLTATLPVDMKLKYFHLISRLSIASAHAFLLVYSVTDPTSFSGVKERLEEIREQRTDFQVKKRQKKYTLTLFIYVPIFLYVEAPTT